jgi:hypothetical protein
MVSVSQDIRMAVDRVAFAEKLGIVPDQWQRDLLRSSSSGAPALLIERS